MSDKVISAADLSLEGETLANDYHWRSTKAKQQLRDRFGRWISLGANVKFHSNGAEQSGIVTSVIDGKAYVDQKNLDGTVTQQILDPSAIRVIASKATLPPDGAKVYDAGNNFYKKMDSPEFRKAMSTTGQAVITRADGYALSASTLENSALGTDNKALNPQDATQKDDKGNPILYQLFAPGGRSLGIYSAGAEADFDNMVASDKGAQAPTGDQTAPVAQEAPIAASLASDIVVSGENAATYRVPDSVKSNISFALKNGNITHPVDRAHAQALASQEHVTLEQVEWIGKYFEAVEPLEQLRGGYAGRKWASKILSPAEAPIVPEPDEMGHPKYLFDDDAFGYFAIGSVSGSTLVSQLLSVNYETGDVFAWGPDGFELIPDVDMTEVDEPQIIPIDEMTADEFAHWLDSGIDEDYDILDADPEERNLFTLAESEIDYDELDRAYSIIAAAGDGVYTPVERSQNAKVQQRGAGGKFGGGGGGSAAKAPEGGAEKVQKATLPVELPLVENPAARISEWLSTAAEAPVVAAGEAPAPEAPADGNPPADQALEDSATGPTNEALYFAIVDDVDKTAVMDAIAIVKSNGTPSAFIRSKGVWTASPDTLASLQGSTPPPVVELTDPATVKTVLQQIDAHDAEAEPADTPDSAPAPAPAPAPVAASGFAMADGSYTIIDSEDLRSAVVASGASPDIFVKAHIRKRARALNRMDLVPAGWREFTLAEIGELSAARTVYGEFGEIIVAAGVPGIADTPSDMRSVAKLQNYWTRGKGALKIRWGTKGDLTRAHRHLAKYVGPQRAWGLAQKYHRSIFGVYNHTHDVATGQYVPKKRK